MLYEVMEDGELILLENPPDNLSDDMAVIFISPFSKTTYIWVGPNAGLSKKFVAAREGRSKRMESGYPIVHVQNDNAETKFEEDYKKFLEQVKGKTDSSTTTRSAKPKRSTSKATTKKAEISSRAVKQEPVMLIEAEKEDLDPYEVLRKLNELSPIEGMIRDYVIIYNRVAIISDDNGNQKIEFVEELPEGAFFSPHYVPRLLISNNKVIGMELWRKP